MRPARQAADPDRGPPGATADRLLYVAANLFRKKSYAGTTTRELADALGIQKASLYHHIKGKEDLLFEISMESLRRVTEAVAGASAATDPEHRLQTMIDRHIETVLGDRDLHTTMLVELRALSPERQVQVCERRDRYEQLWQLAINEDQHAGRLRKDIDDWWLTKSLLNLLNWTIFWYDPAGDASPTQIARIFSAVFLDGVRARAEMESLTATLPAAFSRGRLAP